MSDESSKYDDELDWQSFETGVGPLFLRYLHGLATESETEQIRDILKSDSPARRYFVELCRQDSLLAEHLTTDQIVIDTLKRLLDERGPSSSVVQSSLEVASNTAGASALKPSQLGKLQGWILSIAAVLLIAVTAVLISRGFDRPNAPVEAQVAEKETNIEIPVSTGPPVVAKVTRKIDCVWEDDKWKLGSRTHLAEGDELRLERGLVELTFDHGTVVIVQGPAKFLAESAMKLHLDYGALTVKADEGVNGFEVATRGSRIIDVGTEFGIDLPEHGEATLSVYDGEVLVDSLSESSEPTPASISVTEEATDDSIQAVKEKFAITVSQDELTHRSLELGSDYAVPEMPATRNLALWLSAGAGVKKDKVGGVEAWADLLVGDNREQQSAWQVLPDRRPQWDAAAMNGQPAVRFNGQNSFMLTEPLSTTDEQTITALVKVSKREVPKPQPYYIFDYAGPPSLILSYRQWQGEIVGSAFLGFASKAKGKSPWINKSWLAAVPTVTGVPHLLEEPVICTYVYSRSGNQAKLFIDGELRKQSKASAEIALTSSRVIGARRDGEKHHLSGCISEMLIHNEALPSADVVALHASIAGRYGLELQQ